MNTAEFTNRVEAIVTQTLELLTEVERKNELVEEHVSETEGKIRVKNAINRIKVNTEALESVAQKTYKHKDQEEQING